MDKGRIIPCLDIREGKVVKGVNFLNIREVGDPLELAKFYDTSEADELVMLDIAATVEGRPVFTELVATIAKEVSLPITVGGGVRSVDDAQSLFDSGASKVSVSSQAVAEPSLIDALATRFGTDRIVCAIDVKRRGEGSWTVVTRGGSSDSGLDVFDWATEVVKRGAGEILLTSMDTDGVRQGYDIELYRQVGEAIDVPLIASGGAGTMAHFEEVFTKTGVSGALGASIFHFREVEIPKLKIFLSQCGIPMRS